jgi:hypothetical protein
MGVVSFLQPYADDPEARANGTIRGVSCVSGWIEAGFIRLEGRATAAIGERESV